MLLEKTVINKRLSVVKIAVLKFTIVMFDPNRPIINMDGQRPTSNICIQSKIPFIRKCVFLQSTDGNGQK